MSSRQEAETEFIPNPPTGKERAVILATGVATGCLFWGLTTIFGEAIVRRDPPLDQITADLIRYEVRYFFGFGNASAGMLLGVLWSRVTLDRSKITEHFKSN